MAQPTAGRVLLTGASGLIGRQCVPPLLDAGFDVVVASRDGSAPAGTSVLAVDLLDHERLADAVSAAGASHLLHLAWHTGAKDRWTSPANLEWTAATLHLVRAFAAAGGKRAVGVGSCAEYDWSFETLTEDTPLRPATLYGAAKAAASLALINAAPALGLSFAWARVFFCFGPGEPPGRLFGDLVRGLTAGEPIDCTDGLQERDFLHTGDIASALTALLASDVEGPVNIAQGETIAVRDLVMTVAEQIGRTDLVRLGAIPRPAGDPPRLAATVDRLRTQVGFQPRYSLTEGVAQVLAADGVS